MDPKEKLRKDQSKIALKLQTMLLKDFERLLDAEEMTGTDRATLYKILRDNGWDFDPQNLPQELVDKIRKKVTFDDDEDSNPNIHVM